MATPSDPHLHPAPKPHRRIEHAFRSWLRTQRCCVPDCRSSTRVRVHAAHVRSRGAGGADPNNLVPLCARHHLFQHTLGRTSFETRFHIDLTEAARKYWRAWRVLAARAPARHRMAF